MNSRAIQPPNRWTRRPRLNAARRSEPHASRVRGFTLLELLVVIVIIGILASIGLPALRGLGRGNVDAAAQRQLLDDLAYARLRAISDGSAVYMVFVPPTNVFQRISSESNPNVRKQLENLVPGQFRSYALLAERTAGDQPGQRTPRYLTEWKTLPEGVFFAPHQFDPKLQANPNPFGRAFPVKLLPFPNANSALTPLPYIGFDPQGRLLAQRDEAVSWLKGGIFYPENDAGDYLPEPPDVVLTPAVLESTESIRIHWLTGRTEVESPEFE